MFFKRSCGISFGVFLVCFGIFIIGGVFLTDFVVVLFWGEWTSSLTTEKYKLSQWKMTERNKINFTLLILFLIALLQAKVCGHHILLYQFLGGGCAYVLHVDL